MTSFAVVRCTHIDGDIHAPQTLQTVATYANVEEAHQAAAIMNHYAEDLASFHVFDLETGGEVIRTQPVTA
jgi:ketosteroid isomerase-like protein